MNNAQAKAIANSTLAYLMNLKGIDKWWEKLPQSVKTQIKRGLAKAVLEGANCSCKRFGGWYNAQVRWCMNCDKPRIDIFGG